MPETKWLKSSHSEASANNCVEISLAEGDRIALRESSHSTQIITAHPTALEALLRGIKSGYLQ
ncbi:DUF397 domain-containing protein [Streptomyces sp. NPDC003077]|uniref:DUF397 domain-containing protein n=1 Tax=Streptomyces sp. NPDC003077 TaxID=3154443 RepID=UPI0033AF7FA4